MLPLPLSGVAADEYERRGLVEPLDGARVGADQEREALDRHVATDVEEDRAAGSEGGEFLVTVGDAPRPPALIPAARLLKKPAAPKRNPLLSHEWSPREALKLDAAREAAQLRPLPAEQEGGFCFRPRRHDQQVAAPPPRLQPPAPIFGGAPALRRSCLDRAQHRELGAVQLANHGCRGEGARGGLVGRRQAVRMKQVG